MTHRRPIQTTRVLRALDRAGKHGITQIDFDAPDVIDGGTPIKRVAARVHELAEQGYRIEEAGRRNRCKVYRLSAAARPTTLGSPPAPSSPTASAETPRRVALGGDPKQTFDLEPLCPWWACMSCGTRSRAAEPAQCCEDMVAIRVCIAVPVEAGAQAA